MEILSLILQIQQMSMSLNLKNLLYLREIFNCECPIIAINYLKLNLNGHRTFLFSL